MTLTAMVPPRVDRSLCANCTGLPPLFSQHGNTRAERVEIAQITGSAGVDRIDVLDEVTPEVSPLVGPGPREGLVVRAGRIAADVVPAGDVESPEIDHRHPAAPG